MTAPSLQFLGAAETVTGSKFLLSTSKGNNVLIDCGMFQGMKDLRRRNWQPLPVKPASIQSVVLTHAHIDHSGYLPRLVKEGFRGNVYCTSATMDLLHLLLPDSGHLQEEEARYANKKGFTRHKPALPLYTEAEARKALKQLVPMHYGKDCEPSPGITVRAHPSGHILGAAFLEVDFDGKKLICSGDLGAYGRIVMRDPAPIPSGVDYIMMESTYGGRLGEPEPVQDQLQKHLKPALEGGAVVVIPAFAVGRTTLVLYHIRKLQEEGKIPDVPLFVDSPMATDAVELYLKYGDEHNLKVNLLRSNHECPIRLRRTHLVRSVEESKQLNRHAGPAVVITASGMATGGRVLHHLKNRLPDSKNLVLLVGYQVAGTRGRALVDGAKKLRIHGADVPVRAKVRIIHGLSAHADSNGLFEWLRSAKKKPKKIFLVHGEDDGIRALGDRIARELNQGFHVPKYLQKVML